MFVLVSFANFESCVMWLRSEIIESSNAALGQRANRSDRLVPSKRGAGI